MKYGAVYLLSFFFVHLASGQVLYRNNEIVYENEQIISRLSFQHGTVKPFLFSRALNKPLLAAGNQTAWFEFVVNGIVISSDDPVWTYREHRIRKLNNGGEEVNISLEAIKKIPGLQVNVYRQYFPNSTLIRERLVLTAKGESLRLTKRLGKLHFIFPRYAVATQAAVTDLEEIRIATFNQEILPAYDASRSYDDRKFDNARDYNLSQAHMFHPWKGKQSLKPGDSTITKGPFGIYRTERLKWITAYEHASQDKTFAAEADDKRSGTIAVDAQQGVSSPGSLAVSEDDFWFLGFKTVKKAGSLVVSLEQLRGGYLDGEPFDMQHPY